MNMETKNAIIRSVKIEIEDHGLLTAWVQLDYGGAEQAFGGYNLAGSCASVFIRRVLDVSGATVWSEVQGKTVRVRCEHMKVHAIGHIVADSWFCPETDFKK